MKHIPLYKLDSTGLRIRYIASDGTVFYNRVKLRIHENKLTQLKLEWYDKRFTVYWQLMYFFFKKEPPKPFKF